MTQRLTQAAGGGHPGVDVAIPGDSYIRTNGYWMSLNRYGLILIQTWDTGAPVRTVSAVDAMRINGRNALACKVLVKDLGTNDLTVEPLLGLKVQRDLIVDMDPFFEHFKSVQPFFISDQPLPEDGKERLQSPADRERFDDTTKCILCAACTTSCPSFWSNGQYVGPAAIVNAHRFIYDTRDTAAAERLKISQMIYSSSGAAGRLLTAQKPARGISKLPRQLLK